MGIILSAIAVANKAIKKSRDKKKTAQIRKVETAASQTPAAPPPPSSPTPEHTVEGGCLRDEDDLTSSPAATTTTPGIRLLETSSGPADPVLGIEAPLPLSTGATTTTTTTAVVTQQAAELEPRASRTGEGGMASDEDYAAFLDKANADPREGVGAAEGQKSSSGGVQFQAVDHGAEVPLVLKEVTKDAFYVSDADEPFEPVYRTLGGKVKGKGSLPDEVVFARLVNHPNPGDAEVSILDIGEWDPSGQYKEIVDAVREATKGSDVRVYRISRGGSRVEYWVVGIEGGRLVGAKALAIES